MAAPEGNEYYKLRTKDGRDKIYEKPEDLAEACNEYFQWIEKNPFKEDNVFVYQGHATHEPVKKMRSMSLEGLCNFIDIAKSTFQEYEKRKGFTAITTRAKQIIDAQQFEGAASGFLNPSIIARKLGLIDKQEHSGKITISQITGMNIE